MYRISLKKRPSLVPWKLRINLSLHDTRTCDGLLVPRKYLPIGFTVLRDDPLLCPIASQSSLCVSRDVSLEVTLINDINRGFISSLLVIPFTSSPDPSCQFLLSFSIQSDLHPRGIVENSRYTHKSIHQLHRSHEVVAKVCRTHWMSTEPVLYEYAVSCSNLSLVDVDRITGWREYAFTTSVHDRWNRADRTAAGRIGKLNDKSANNPCFRLSLLPSDTASTTSTNSQIGYEKVSLLILLSQSAVPSTEGQHIDPNDIKRIACCIMTPRGLAELAMQGGACNPKELLGDTAFEQRIQVTRRFDCRMRVRPAVELNATKNNLQTSIKQPPRTKEKSVFVLPEEKIYYDILLMPATWLHGEEGKFELTVWSNVGVKLSKIQKNTLKELKSSLKDV